MRIYFAGSTTQRGDTKIGTIEKQYGRDFDEAERLREGATGHRCCKFEKENEEEKKIIKKAKDLGVRIIVTREE